MRFAGWIPKATNTLRVCNIAFILQRWFQERTSVLRHMYIACLVCQFCMFKHFALAVNKETDNIKINKMSFLFNILLTVHLNIFIY